MQSSEQLGSQPPAGYPTGDVPGTETKKLKKSFGMKKKGERGFIEGCLFALCCCWLCEECF